MEHPQYPKLSRWQQLNLEAALDANGPLMPAMVTLDVLLEIYIGYLLAYPDVSILLDPVDTMPIGRVVHHTKLGNRRGILVGVTINASQELSGIMLWTSHQRFPLEDLQLVV